MKTELEIITEKALEDIANIQYIKNIGLAIRENRLKLDDAIYQKSGLDFKKVYTCLNHLKEVEAILRSL